MKPVSLVSERIKTDDILRVVYSFLIAASGLIALVI